MKLHNDVKLWNFCQNIKGFAEGIFLIETNLSENSGGKNTSRHHLLDPLYFGDIAQQTPFDAGTECHAGHGTIDAGAGQFHFDKAVVAHAQKFDIAAVRLQERTDRI